MAEELGHTVTELKPSLVPLECHEGFCSKLSGLSLEEKSEYNVAFPGIVDALNGQIADYSFTTGIARLKRLC